MTKPPADASPQRSTRRITPRGSLPSGRALVGAFLITAAALGAFAVTSASREAVRAFVEAPDADTGFTTAQRRADETLLAFGRHGDRASVGIPDLPNGFTRCGRVSIDVTYDIPALSIPFIGGFGRVTTVQSSYTELIDPFRDGLPGATTY